MMQRKPGFPVANCSIRMPDGMALDNPVALDEEGEFTQRRQQLINFGHIQWGFSNWNWSVTKQDLDFVDFSNGKYCAGVVAFVSVSVKTLDIHRENIGYATSLALNKGAAIHKARKCAVTNALRETLLSFGGTVATELLEMLEPRKAETPGGMPPPPTTPVSAPPAPAPSAPPVPAPTPHTAPEPQIENNQNVPNKQEPKNSPLNKNVRKDGSDIGAMRPPHPAIKNAVPHVGNPLPVAKAHPMPVLPPAAAPPSRPPHPAAVPAPRPLPHPAPPHPSAAIRPNSNEGRPLESMTEEEARAERKRRQQRAQEEFRKKHQQGHDDTEAPRASTSSSMSFDTLLMDIPTQDIEIEQTGEDTAKRKSPVQEGNAKKRAVISRLDILTD